MEKWDELGSNDVGYNPIYGGMGSNTANKSIFGVWFALFEAYVYYSPSGFANVLKTCHLDTP